MESILIPPTYNYIAAFLTLNCNLKCSYCINKFGNFAPRKLISGKEWVESLNRIKSRPDLPITLQGGEPSLHPDFYDIINGIKPELNIDLLTNLQFNIYEFMDKVSPTRLKRDAPYASIRVSYHPEQIKVTYFELLDKVRILKDAGYSVGIWAVDHPKWHQHLLQTQFNTNMFGIDFRLKEFLGEYNGILYGEYKYKDACDGEGNSMNGKDVYCKTTELIIGPDGETYRCHSDLYSNRYFIGNIKGNYIIKDIYRLCGYYGKCNPCDLKIKNNRFQEFGHTSVAILEDECGKFL